MNKIRKDNKKSNGKILITGATGFIGTYLVKALLDEKYEVYILNHKSYILDSLIKNDLVKIFKVDITKEKDFHIIPQKAKFDAIFHLAAYIPLSANNKASQFKYCFEVNALGTYNLLKFCQKMEINKIINSSSILVYNNTESTLYKFTEKHQTKSASMYGHSKIIGEQFCQAFVNTCDMNIITLRYSFVYGAGQNLQTVIPIFISRAKNNQDIVIYGKGNNVRDFIYIKDAIKANLLSLRANVKGIYNIGSGQGVSMTELAKTIIKVYKSKSKIVYDTSKKEDISNVVLNINKAKKDLKYYPDYYIKEGLLDYY